MDDLKPLVPVKLGKVKLSTLGKRGELRWLKLGQLFIDPRYQRNVGVAGTENIRKIATEFSWAFFSPDIVSPRANGRYAIIDGQHRSTGALSRGDVDEIPCYIVPMTPQEEALAFAKINGTITKVSPMAIFRAEFMAAKPEAVKLSEVVYRADVIILGYPKVASTMTVGETMAVGTIKKCLALHGERVLVAALTTITRTGDGNPGLVKEETVSGTCDALAPNPSWITQEAKLLAAVGAVGVPALLQRAKASKGTAGTGSLREHYAAAFHAAVAPAFKPAQVAVGAHVNPPPDHPALAPRKPAPATSSPLPPKKPGSDQALIAAAVAAGKVRVFDTADSSEFWVLAEYMCNRTGKEFKMIQREPSLDGRAVSWDKFYALVNAERAKEKKPPITPKQGAQR